MPISVRFLSIAWIVGACLSAAGIGGYLIYDFINPTGSQWLLDSGYIFNPPKITNRKKWSYGCADNIFKQDQDFDNNKLYACKVVSLNTWNEKNKVQDKSLDYVALKSEYVLRKGNQGWKIFSILDSRLGPIEHTQISVYEKKGNSNRWTQKRVWYLGQQPKSAEKRTNSLSKRKSNPIQTIASENKFLWIKIHNEEWYKGQDISSNGQSTTGTALSENWKNRKSGSWIWIEGNESTELDPVKIFDSTTSGGSADYTDSWLEHLFHMGANYFYYEDSIKKQTLYNQMDNVKNQAKGKWINAEEFCKYGYERGISEDQKKNLRMYCAKPKG